METMVLYSLIAFAVVVTAIILTETEHWWGATLTMIASVVALHFVGGVNVVAFLQAHLMEVGLYALAYVAAGVIWSFIKWFSFLHRFRDTYHEAKEGFRKVYDDNVEVGHYISFQMVEQDGKKTRVPAPVPSYEDELAKLLKKYKKPTAADNKGRIIGWMAFWPFSFVGTFLNDPVRRLFNALYNRFKRLYQKMADHVFRNDTDLA